MNVKTVTDSDKCLASHDICNVDFYSDLVARLTKDFLEKAKSYG